MQLPPPPPETQDNNQVENKKDLQKVQLGKVTATAEREFEAYQSGNQIGREMLDSNPSGNGDITSILKILPNVQFDNAQYKSTTPGEIDPANISISGGLFYQNNFQLDGFNMNNDLDPLRTNNNGDGPPTVQGGRSQGLAVDTSLLESVTVLDSNVSAAYGRFTGGVVEANVRKPRQDEGGIKGWHSNFSYQHTSSGLTQYYIHEDSLSSFATSSDENYQPNFNKHIIRASVEGWASKNLGLIASYSTTRSYIPLNAYNSTIVGGTSNGDKREQTRTIDNYYAKLHYNPLENLTIEANLAYMPQDNTYFNALAKDSFRHIKSGGIQSGIKALWQTPVGLWSNSLSYSFLEQSKRSEADYWLQWYRSDDKNWAWNANNILYEGGTGNIDKTQHTVEFKTDMTFTSLVTAMLSQTFRIGFESSYQYAKRDRLQHYYRGNWANANLNGASWCNPNIPDELGLFSCSLGQTTNGFNGQYVSQLINLKAGKVSLDTFTYGIYAEDDANIDLGKGGSINTRFGLRLDGDNYMSKHTLAPRFSLNYVTPAPKQYKSQLTFGINRYYARNLLSYRLYDLEKNFQARWVRDAATGKWTDQLAGTGQFARPNYVSFGSLNVPYSDELMGGVLQNLDFVSINLKYIYRAGKDELMQKFINGVNGTREWSNDGRSQSHIVSLIISNAEPINTFGVLHHYLFAFDYTKVYRSYNLDFSTTELGYDEQTMIDYNGSIIAYENRPTQNWARPFTLRFSTTHNFNIGRTKWLLNNFFRYRAGYEAMVLVGSAGSNNPNGGTYAYDTYRKWDFLGAFNWDMRLGFEVDIWRGQTLYFNADIYNVLNAKNMTTLGTSDGSIASGIALASTAIPVYELGRQFWFQVGYKF
ncbi:TonB-dependent receptor plug domain-containing protein [Helicobacter sp. 23-1048]